MLAGHGGDAVTWLSEVARRLGDLVGVHGEPVAAVKAFVDGQPDRRRLRQDRGAVCCRQARYQDPDDAPGRSAAARAGRQSFPHVLDERRAASRTSDFHDQWERSPFADAYLGRFAAGARRVDAARQARARPTCSAVSFSSPDLVGHAFGPRSQEVQDMYAHLDRTLGTLLDRLDALVGRDQYVVALTRGPRRRDIPEQLAKRTGRRPAQLDARALARSSSARAGRARPGPLRGAASNGNDVYFEPGMYEKLAARPGALDAVVEDAHRSSPAVARVFRSEELANAARDSRRSVWCAPRPSATCRARSGDLVARAEARLDVHGDRHDARQRERRRPARPGDLLRPRHQARPSIERRRRRPTSRRRWRRSAGITMPQCRGPRSSICA